MSIPSSATATCSFLDLPIIPNAMRPGRCGPRGITGKLVMCDGKTSVPRTFIDIEKIAQLRTVETGNAPRFRKAACAESPYSPETDEAGTQTSTNSTEAA